MAFYKEQHVLPGWTPRHMGLQQMELKDLPL